MLNNQIFIQISLDKPYSIILARNNLKYLQNKLQLPLLALSKLIFQYRKLYSLF